MHHTLLGSYSLVRSVVTFFPQKTGGKIDYLIAGSWAIELTTNKKWKHTDLDIIALGNPVKYIDNALTKKEHCNGPIPIPPEYFHHKSSFRMCKNKKDGIMFYTPNLQLQLAFKLIGELDNDLSKRAISQLLALCHAYKLLKKENVKKELAYIYFYCLADDVNPKELADITTKAILSAKARKRRKAIRLFKQTHKIINKSLKRAFKNQTK